MIDKPTVELKYENYIGSDREKLVAITLAEPRYIHDAEWTLPQPAPCYASPGEATGESKVVARIDAEADMWRKAARKLAKDIRNVDTDCAYVAYVTNTPLGEFANWIKTFLDELYDQLGDMPVLRPVVIGAPVVTDEERFYLTRRMHELGLTVVPQEFDYFAKFIFNNGVKRVQANHVVG